MALQGYVGDPTSSADRYAPDDEKPSRRAGRRGSIPTRGEVLEMARSDRNAQKKEQLIKWFEKYDTDASGLLERSELRLLLKDAEPQAPTPSDALVDRLIQRVTDERRHLRLPDDGITVDEIVSVVLRYNEYLLEEKKVRRPPSPLAARGRVAPGAQAPLARCTAPAAPRLRAAGPVGLLPTAARSPSPACSSTRRSRSTMPTAAARSTRRSSCC